MLEIGNGGQSTTEYQSEVSLWAMMNAPLISGTDLRAISAADLSIYTNKAVIALNQDALGKRAIPVAAGGEPAGNKGLWVLDKPLSNGDTAIALFNSTGSTQTISTSSAELSLGKGKKFTMQNLWTKNKSQTAGTISASVPAHGTVLYRISKGSDSSVAPNTTVEVSGVPASATPGQTFAVTASVTNHAKTTIQEATLRLKAPSGWKVKATTGTVFNNLRTGDTASAQFTFTAPTTVAPIETDSLTAVAQYSWPGGITSNSSSADVQLVSPVQSPNMTFSSAADAAAVYGQNGADYAVSGAGSDMWSGHDNYTAIYRKAVVGSSSSVTTTVSSAANLSGFGKTGILVRNDITAAGSAPERCDPVRLAVRRIQLEWASGGGQYIDQVTPANGTIDYTVPVTLKPPSTTQFNGFDVAAAAG